MWQLLLDSVLIFVAVRLLCQPALLVLPESAWSLVHYIAQIPGVQYLKDGALLFSYGVDVSAFPLLCFTP